MGASESDSRRGLVGAAIRGDAEAVRALWQEHRRWVAAVLLAHKPRHAELDDLLQDVAMSFVRMIGSLRDESTLKPWLRTVAINAARAAGREAQRKPAGLRLVRPGPEGDADGPGPSLAASEEARRLLDLARRLPEGYREPLLLRCVRGLSYQRIGELLGLPETTIETRIARGRRMLREMALADEASAPAEAAAESST